MSQYWEGVEGAPASVRQPSANPSVSEPADPPGYFLTTKRLGFRCWTARDEDLAIDLWCNPQVTALIGGPWTRDVALKRLAQEIEQQNQYGMQYWSVFLVADGRHAGCAGIRPYEAGKASYEMGVHLLPEFWGRGIAREAAEAIIPRAFGPLGATAIVAGHHPQNVASGRLLIKLGFAYQGDKLYIPTGLMHPMYLLRREQAASG
ncbi:MAG: GNAT family N-acetyltransferase [Terracidiphilus sp.]|jgi:RimJ/RimL family protein N-acetyltransferase